MFLVTVFVVALCGVERWWVLLVESQCFVLLFNGVNVLLFLLWPSLDYSWPGCFTL